MNKDAPFGNTACLRKIRLDRDRIDRFDRYPHNLPVVRHLHELD